ncbi:OmpA family protein [Albibacterium sp.]|uniref:OmpA family protein n=1 Tax=Albibacterium sp. TaxID=2952885 RepID=UPI002CEC8E0F|nr:OmpA family protein [Albibacterium sp.]HUH19118.1 OmpA family protein [Albibacterium sp.]
MNKSTLFIACIASSLFLFSCKMKKMDIKNPAVISYTGQTGNTTKPSNVTETDRGLMMTFASDVLFPINSSYLTDEAKTALLEFVEVVKDHPAANIQVDGHTDATGTAEYNKWLSDKRATSVKVFLVSAGISESRIATQGYGLEKPVDTNSTPEGRQKNRRVEITILN